MNSTVYHVSESPVLVVRMLWRELSISRVSWSNASRCCAHTLWEADRCSKQQRLYFFPLPQGHGSFRPILPFA
jgi:hypothetical protein